MNYRCNRSELQYTQEEYEKLPTRKKDGAKICECHKEPVIPEEEFLRRSNLPRSAGETYDILLNPIPKKDRFGATFKEGQLWYGVIVANDKGEIKPAVVGSSHRFLYGELLEITGLNFGNVIMPSTAHDWDRRLIYEYCSKKIKAPGTPELVEKIRNLNKAVIYHTDERAHSFFACLPLVYSTFTIYKKIFRVLILGLPNSGKSVETEFIAKISPNAILSSDASEASIKRDVEATAGLVCIDNFDNIPNEESLATFRQLYDTSFEADRGSRRCGEKGRNTEEYRTYCPILANGETAAWMRHSSVLRTIFVPMVKAPDEESQKLIKLDKIPERRLCELHHEVRTWALENAKLVSETAKELKVGFQNRDADLALPILVIAKLSGEKVFNEVLSFLKDNFDNYHTEETYSDTNTLFSALWELVSSVEAPEAAIEVRQIAEKTLEEKGYSPTFETKDGTELPVKGYKRKLAAECRDLSIEIKSKIPYEKSTHPKNRLVYHFNKLKLARFLKSRGFEEDSLREVLQHDTKLI